MQATEINDIKATFIARAAREGFGLCRVTRPNAIPEAHPRLMDFLDKNRHGDMAWLAETPTRRADPCVLWPEAKSVIMLGLNYAPPYQLGHHPLEHLAHDRQGLISVYAQRRDYHEIIKKKLRRLVRWLVETTKVEAKLFVDTAPVMEKPLAAAAGLGWQGKHTNLVSRDFGSWLFLASVFTDLALPVDKPASDHCGHCSACLDICPTNAFPSPYQLDARRCISYLTIEHKGVIDEEFRKPMGNRIYGCDDCLAVCPWNKFAQAAHDDMRLLEDLNLPTLMDLVSLDDAGFRTRFAGLPIKRTGRDRFIRNVLIAMGNTAPPVKADFIAAIEARLSDGSPLVRGMAVWALAQHDITRTQEKAAALLDGETDAHVQTEWQAALKTSAVI